MDFLAGTVTIGLQTSVHVTEVNGTITEMNVRTTIPKQGMMALVQSYKTELDNEMNVVIATSARTWSTGDRRACSRTYGGR